MVIKVMKAIRAMKVIRVIRVIMFISAIRVIRGFKVIRDIMLIIVIMVLKVNYYQSAFNSQKEKLNILAEMLEISKLIAGDPKREEFMDEGELAGQAFEVQVTAKVISLKNHHVYI